MKISLYLAGDLKLVLTKYHDNRLRIDRAIGEKHAIHVQDNVTASKSIASTVYR